MEEVTLTTCVISKTYKVACIRFCIDRGSLMIVGVKLNPTSYKKIREFVEKGAYESVESFVEIAVLNQILLESNGVASIEPITVPRIAMSETARSKSSQTKQQSVQQSIQYLACPKDTPLPIVPPLPIPEEIRSFPIWGQINRLAPAKMVLRMLANHILSLGKDCIDLKRFSADVAETATSTRMYIEKKDKKNRIRGEELYIALAKKDPGSQQRFINFYIGKLPSGKWTEGILTGLGLARIEQTEDGSVVIGLTEAGCKLACLHSPLIDEFLLQEKQIEAPLSPGEVEFLLNHLKANKPGEFEYIVRLLRFIREGTATPTSLRIKVGQFLRDRHPTIKMSEKFVNTMLVGAMGRLVEMRLVGIEKDAQKSRYSVTDAGSALLSREAKA